MMLDRITCWLVLGTIIAIVSPPALSHAEDPIFFDGLECGIERWSLYCIGGDCTPGSGGAEPCCVPSLRVVFVDPPVTYNAVDMAIDVYAVEVSGGVAEVSIYPTGEPTQAQALAFSIDPTEPRRIQAVLPAGLGPGDYTLTVADNLGCQGEQIDALRVVGDTTVAIDRLEVPFGWTNAVTRVEVHSPGAPPPGEGNFVATPRLFLSPAAASPGTTATELRLTSFISPLQVSTVVTEGLAVGLYDLMAINPDGGVGVLENAFEVTAAAPPIIRDLVPRSVMNQDHQSVTIEGENFAPGSSVTVSCRQPDLSQIVVPATIDGATTTAIEISFNFITTTVADGSLCIARVTNGDGSYVDSAALAIISPYLLPSDFSPAASMLTARRALCGAAAEAAPGSRFVYAIGGDDGTTQASTATTRYDSIEVAPIGLYGDLGNFFVQPVQLPTPLSFHGCAQLRRYLYVVGGNDGTGAVATAYRARILDPDAAPRILDVDLDVVTDAAPQLAAGMYSYRVSAVMGAGDPDNPGAETLAGDALCVHTPDTTEKLTVSFGWSEVPGAATYRIYRTPTAGLTAGSEVLLQELSAGLRSFTDDGSLIPGSDTPRPLGSTGEFVTLPPLMSAREGAGVVLTGDPSTSDTYHLYALGGRDDTQTALASLEWLDITLEADGTQTAASGWTAGSATIGDARWQLRALVADARSAADDVETDEIWVYALGGFNASTSLLIRDVVGLRVDTDGALGEGADEWWEIGDMLPLRAGFSGALCNSTIFVVGGAYGTPDITASYTRMCTNDLGPCSGGPPEPPDLVNWNNSGLEMNSSRYLSGDAVEGPFIFILGGIDDTWTPLVTTDQVVW